MERTSMVENPMMAASSEVVDRGRSRQSRSYSCRPKEARADIQEAIELANRSGEKEAAEEYASINPNDC
jgi:hypothetical protein